MGFWQKVAGFLIIASFLIPAIPTAQSGTVSTLPAPNHHDPITIEGDGNFTIANGVVAGSGTLSDPFLIAGWNISGPGDHALAIRNTTTSFVVNGCEIFADGQLLRHGVLIWNGRNGAIRNSSISGYQPAVYLYEAGNISIDDCAITGGVTAWPCTGSISMYRNHMVSGGISLSESSDGIAIQDNWLNSSALNLAGCDRGTVSRNVINLTYELEFSDCSNLTIEDNKMLDCSIGLWGISLEKMMTIDISSTNTVNGLPVVFLKNQSDSLVDASRCGQIIGVNIHNVSIIGFTSPSFNSSWYGLYGGTGIAVIFSSNVSIGMCSISEKYEGISCARSSGLSIWDNTITECGIGVSMGLCNDFNISGNDITGTRGQGINIGTSDSGVIYGNRFAGIEECLFAYRMSNLSVVANDFEPDRCLLTLEDVSDCVVYHNNFEFDFYGGNTLWIWGEISNISFDNGLPDGGNYWSGAKRVDKNKDGFSDDPVIVYNGGPPPMTISDRYPLMHPYGKIEGGSDVIWILLAAIVGVIAGLMLALWRPKRFSPPEIKPL